jgi:hypothetical protein
MLDQDLDFIMPLELPMFLSGLSYRYKDMKIKVPNTQNTRKYRERSQILILGAVRDIGPW